MKPEKLILLLFMCHVSIGVHAQWTTLYGANAGQSITTGQRNTYIGHNTGRDSNIGGDNTGVGMQAGLRNHSGSYNLFFGRGAAERNTTGSFNVFIGSFAGLENTSGSGNVFLGHNAGNSELGSNRLYISNDGRTTPLIYGEFDANLARINGSLHVGSSTSPYNLTVFGLVNTKEVRVEVQPGAGPDYVFAEGYLPLSLDSLSGYVRQNGHLLEVPAASELESQGMDVGQMNLILLKKIEELTLYILEQDKRISTLEGAVTKE